MVASTAPSSYDPILRSIMPARHLCFLMSANEEPKGTGVHICTVCPTGQYRLLSEKRGKMPPHMEPMDVARYTLKHVQEAVVVPGISYCKLLEYFLQV